MKTITVELSDKATTEISHCLASVVGIADAAGENKMSKELGAPCSECGGPVRTRRIKQEFEREGMRVSVCPAEGRRDNSDNRHPPRCRCDGWRPCCAGQRAWRERGLALGERAEAHNTKSG